MAGSTIIQLVLRARDEASGILNKAAAGLTAAFAAFKGAEAISQAVDEMGKLNQASQFLNMSMEDLTAAQYAAFKGARVNADQLQDALTEVSIKVKEFSSINSGGAIDFFQIMKADAKEFAKLSPLDQMLKISDVMKDMSADDKRTFLDQIGSDNLRNLLPVLKNGSAEFKQLMTNAKEAGLTLTDLDAVNVDGLQKAFVDLNATVGVEFKKAVAGVAPEVQALVELMTSGFETARDAAKDAGVGTSESFENVYPVLSNILKLTGMVTDGFKVLYLGIKSTVLGIAAQFSDTWDNIGIDSKNSFSSVLSSAKNIMGSFQLWLSDFIGNVVKGLDMIPGGVADGLAARVKSWQSELGKMANENINAKGQEAPRVTSTTTQNLLAKKSIADAEAQQLILDINTGKNTGNDLLKQAEEYQRRAKEIRDENSKLAKDRETERTKQNSGTQGKNNLTNSQTAATLAATRAKLAADLAKMEIDKNIESIQTRQQLDQKALDARATAEKLTATEIADQRLAIDLKANREISDQRKASIGEDLKVLEAQLGAQKKVLGQSTIDSERGTALTAIADIEAQISVKKQEQVNLTSQLANQEALLKADRASALADSQAQVQAIKDQLEVDLLRIRGNDYKADLLEVERDFADTKRILESMGEDSTAAQELVNAKKAKIELDEIDRQYAALKRKLENNQISSKDYLSQVNALGERGQKAAETTGNEADVDRTKDSLESAKSEVFSFSKTWKDLQGSMSNGLGDAFTSIISGSKSAKEAFADMGSAMISTIMQVIAQLLVQYAIQSMMGMTTGGGSTAAGGLSSLFGKKHGGGVIGAPGGMSGYVSPLAFAGALRFHTGGVIGLGPDEVPIIAQRGEEMLTAQDPRHRNNINKGNSGTGGGEQTRVTINNVLDSPSLASALEGPDGERVIMNHIRANRSEIKNM